MNKTKFAMISAALIATGLTGGVIAALSAPGPRGGPDGLWNLDGPERSGGLRGWFKPRSLTAADYDTMTRERFARLDKNSDGVLDATEIAASLTERAGHRPRGNVNNGERFLREFADKDGKVTKDAYLAEVKRRFTFLDLNNDGKITDDDLPPAMRGQAVLKAGGTAVHGPMARVIERLREADVNKDGMIALAAVVDVETKRFDALDRNKDGMVDAADFAQMGKEMVDYGVKRFLHMYAADADGKITRDQYFKVAKERFARLDRKGEGRISFGPADGDGHGRRGRADDRGPDGTTDRAPGPLPGPQNTPPRN